MSKRQPSQIVLMGGGHTHALVLNALKSDAVPDAEITVINPRKTPPYSGMLPRMVVGC